MNGTGEIYLDMTDKEKIAYLESEIGQLQLTVNGLNRALALQNYDRLQEADAYRNDDFVSEETKLEAYDAPIGNHHVKCHISKHKDSEFVYTSFLPIDKEPIAISMTEKSFNKFVSLINKFKETHIK